MPDAQPLALLRRNIDRKPEVIRRVLTEAALRKTILGVAANDEKKAIKAFASHNAENALKTKPKVCDVSSPLFCSPWMSYDRPLQPRFTLGCDQQSAGLPFSPLARHGRSCRASDQDWRHPLICCLAGDQIQEANQKCPSQLVNSG